jgi:hypothetical protein
VPRHVRLEDLVGRPVVDAQGRVAGHLEEIVARREAGALAVAEYHLGVYAVLERLSGGALARSLLRLLPFVRPTLYRVRWQDMDLSDPERPRLRCAREDLAKAA